MRAVCAGCGREMVALRSTKRWCSDACRKRRASGGADPNRPRYGLEGPIWRATSAEVTAAGAIDSTHGQAALLAARMMDDPNESVRGWLALSKQLEGLLAAMKRPRPRTGGTSDDLSARRDRKRGADW